MPEYEFKCWTEKDIDINAVPFTKEAYESGKLAFVADYTRVYALANIGGIYMDTDVSYFIRSNHSDRNIVYLQPMNSILHEKKWIYTANYWTKTGVVEIEIN